MPRYELRGTVAVVTGAGSGIGRALALAFARDGASVALADVDEPAVRAAADEARRAGAPAASAQRVDVGDADAMHAFADAVAARHGRATILVNNAGVASYGTVDETPIAEYERVLRVNLYGAIHGVQAFLPLLRREPWARIVSISSVYGLVAPPEHSAYAASKFAVRGFTEALRHELEGTPVGVSVVHPGGIATAIAERTTFARSVSDAERSELVQAFAQVARTSPERAAAEIVRGIRRGDPRILVGPDARFISIAQRLFPRAYWRIIGAIEERMGGAREIRARRRAARLAGRSDAEPSAALPALSTPGARTAVASPPDAATTPTDRPALARTPR